MKKLITISFLFSTCYGQFVNSYGNNDSNSIAAILATKATAVALQAKIDSANTAYATFAQNRINDTAAAIRGKIVSDSIALQTSIGGKQASGSYVVQATTVNGKRSG